MNAEMLMCVDCGHAGLREAAGGLACPDCNRTYPIEDGIYRMLPKDLAAVKAREIAARDEDSVKYDQRSHEYKAALDHFCFETKPIARTDAVLDLGCGTGRSAVKLAARAGSVVGVDFSFESLRLAKAKVDEAGLGNVTLIEADVNRLPLAGGEHFTFINIMDMVQPLPSFALREALLQRAYGYAAPGARLSVTSYHYSTDKRRPGVVSDEARRGEGGKRGYHLGGIYYYNFAADELLALVSQAGFRVTEMRQFWFAWPFPIGSVVARLGIPRLWLEGLTYPLFKHRAWRVYIHAVK